MNNNERREICVHAFTGLSKPQTLNIVRYIKMQRVMVLIELRSAHSFIDKRLAKSLNCFLYLVKTFHVLVANGGSVDCGGK